MCLILSRMPGSDQGDDDQPKPEPNKPVDGHRWLGCVPIPADMYALVEDLFYVIALIAIFLLMNLADAVIGR